MKTIVTLMNSFTFHTFEVTFICDEIINVNEVQSVEDFIIEQVRTNEPDCQVIKMSMTQ